jgi:hypothetical protein
MSRTAPVTVVATEDYDLRLRVSEREPVAYLGEPLTSCRVHQGSLSANERFRRGSTKFTLRSRATRHPTRPASRPRTPPSSRTQEPASGAFRPVSRPPDAPLPQHDPPDVTAPFPPLLRGTLVDVDDPAARRRRTAPRLLRRRRR